MVDKTSNYANIEMHIKSLALSANPSDALLHTVMRHALKTFDAVQDILISMNSDGPIAEALQQNDFMETAIKDAAIELARIAPGVKIDSKVKMGTAIADYLNIRSDVNPKSLNISSAINLEPVDTSNRMLTDGSPIPDDHSHTELKENGQQKDYVVLSPEERAKGFVRPLRLKYIHVGTEPLYKDNSSLLLKLGANGCGETTQMPLGIAETFATSPNFYTGTFCCGCKKHLPLNEFVWYGTNEILGS